MNKALPIIIVVILLLLGGGAYLVLQNGQGQQSTPGTSTQQGQTQQGNIFTSIKDALSKSLSLECTYKDAKGTETKTYIKSGAVRVDAKVTTAGSEANSQTIFGIPPQKKASSLRSPKKVSKQHRLQNSHPERIKVKTSLQKLKNIRMPVRLRQSLILYLFLQAMSSFRISARCFKTFLRVPPITELLQALILSN